MPAPGWPYTWGLREGVLRWGLAGDTGGTALLRSTIGDWIGGSTHP